MAADISWWALDGCWSFLVASEWLLIFPDGLITTRRLHDTNDRRSSADQTGSQD